MKKNDDQALWIEFAESDLELAKVGKVSKKILYETLCYHCQQSCEKSFKAILILNKVDFPKTHDLEFLINLIKKSKIDIPDKIAESRYLTKYAVMSRYPGDELHTNRKDYLAALKTSTLILKWAKGLTDKKHDKLF